MDATLAASAIVVGLQSIVSREIAPAEPAVVTVGKLVSGTKGNIISGEAEMEGTVRTFDRALRKTMPDRITRIAKDIASAYRCTADVEYEFSVDVLINDEAATAVAAAAAKKVVAAPAMYHTAKEKKKKIAAGLLMAAALCSFFTGVTEPLEFSFMVQNSLVKPLPQKL